MEGQKQRLHVSETPFAGAVDAAQLFSLHAAEAGIEIEVVREPEDGYWSKIWGKTPLCASRWSGRANEDLMLTLAYSRQSIGSWNSTKWDNEAFNKALDAARGERDDARRKELLWECQAILHTDGGLIAPVWADLLILSEAVRMQHGSGESWLPSAPPDAVAMVQSTAEVSQVLAICNRLGVPVIPFGAGSSMEGQIHAAAGGISLDLSAMNAILDIQPADMDCTVQCGVTRQQLNEELRATGLFFPIDLGAHATLGGMAATRASGRTTVRYGTMRELVLGLTVVMPDGRVIRTGGRARKSAAGYDLTRLMIGSEGTLGVITELTLRLFGIPEAARTVMCSFAALETATGVVVNALQCGLALNRIELADALQMRAINAHAGSALPEHPTLWIELTGSAATVDHDVEVLTDLIADAVPLSVEAARNAEDGARLWRIRHGALYASRSLRPGIKGISTDVCVPVSRLPDCIAAIRSEIAETSIQAPLIGHVGDGNFHLVLLFDPEDPAESAEARRLNGALIGMALSMGGTCTGEHGVGLGKKAYMAAEHGPALDVMRAIKAALDPRGIMNPGKIFDL